MLFSKFGKPEVGVQNTFSFWAIRFMSRVLPDLGRPPTKNISRISRFNTNQTESNAIFLRVPFIFMTKELPPSTVDNGIVDEPRTN
jgi:hypothetical protein